MGDELIRAAIEARLRTRTIGRNLELYDRITSTNTRAIALARQVLEGGPKDRERYLSFLKSGGSKYPLDLLRRAGVNMETPEPVAAAMDRFKQLVEELEKLV